MQCSLHILRDSRVRSLEMTQAPLECDSSGMSCKVFDDDIKAQTQIGTGTPGACAVTFASQELDCELASIQHNPIL